MTQREKTLAGVLVGLLVFVGGGLGGYLFVYRPLTEVNTQIELARSQADKKDKELQVEEQQNGYLLRLNPRLSQWNKLSLPPRAPNAKPVPVNLQADQKKKHLNQLGVDYQTYLRQLLADSGLKGAKITLRPFEQRNVGSSFRGPPPAYERLGFNVTDARGTMADVSKALREFYKTPLLHQVRNLTLSTTDQARGGTPGVLELKMSVEALMMNAGEARVGLLPSKLIHTPVVLADPARDYASLDKRNMFTGYTVRSDSPGDETPSGPKEKKEDVLRFVKVTMLAYNPTRDRWEATIYDQAKGGNEKKLNARLLNEITIADRYKNTVLEARVVYIDESQMVILADKKYYRLHCGDMLADGMKKSLRGSELEALGIEPEEEKKEDKAEEEG